jgi:hypothetical protein
LHQPYCYCHQLLLLVRKLVQQLLLLGQCCHCQLLLSSLFGWGLRHLCLQLRLILGRLSLPIAPSTYTTMTAQHSTAQHSTADQPRFTPSLTAALPGGLHGSRSIRLQLYWVGKTHTMQSETLLLSPEIGS